MAGTRGLRVLRGPATLDDMPLPARLPGRLAATAVLLVVTIAGAGCTGGPSPSPTPTTPPGVTVKQAQSVANQVVTGWRAAHKTSWDPVAWDAVDAFPARVADDAAVQAGAARRDAGTYQPSTFPNTFTVRKVYAHSTTDGTEYLLVAGYYVTPAKKAIADSDAVQLYVREGAGSWRYASGVGSEGVSGTTAAKRGLAVSFTPLAEQPGVDVSTTGTNADLLAALQEAARPKAGTTSVTADGTKLTAGAEAWGGDYYSVKAADCTVPSGPAIASFDVQEGALSLVQLDCDVELSTGSKTLIVWTDPVTGKQVLGSGAKLRVLYEALVRTEGGSYTVLAHYDRWAGLPTVTK